MGCSKYACVELASSPEGSGSCTVPPITGVWPCTQSYLFISPARDLVLPPLFRCYVGVQPLSRPIPPNKIGLVNFVSRLHQACPVCSVHEAWQCILPNHVLASLVSCGARSPRPAKLKHLALVHLSPGLSEGCWTPACAQPHLLCPSIHPTGNCCARKTFPFTATARRMCNWPQWDSASCFKGNPQMDVPLLSSLVYGP